MTIYELTQAIARYKRAVLIGLGVILLLVLGLMFTYEDGGFGWRGGLKYESAFEISVVTPGTDTLSSPDPTGDVSGTAAEYAGLLSSAEAAEVIGDMSGYRLEEPISAETELNSGVIVGSVIGPTPDLAKAASQNTFVWLARKIQQPLDAQPEVTVTIPPPPDVSLEDAFSSSLSVEIDRSLDSVPPDLFVLVDAGGGEAAAVPVAARAGGSVDATATLEAGGSILLRLETSNGILLDTLRLAPGSLPKFAPAYPTLVVTLGPDSLQESTIETVNDDGDDTTEITWILNAEAIDTEWLEGVPTIDADDAAVTQRQVQVALLTEVPTALQIGGRRAPLLGFTVLMVGVIVLLTGVIVADTWRRAREESKAAYASRTSDDINSRSSEIGTPDEWDNEIDLKPQIEHSGSTSTEQ